MNDYNTDEINECVYYVYIYLDPRKPGRYVYGDYCFLYEPFYVGKGHGKRCLNMKDRSNFFKNKSKKIKKCGLDPIMIKIKDNITNEESIKLEIELINLIGRKDLNEGLLINFTDGGEGTSGYKWNDDQIEKRSEKTRKDFDVIQKAFERENCKLLTLKNEYKNSSQKLKCICPNGHYYEISWNNFQQGHRCPYDSLVSRSEKRKKDFDVIQKAFKERGCKLLTLKNEYKSAKHKLKYICPNGHYHEISWSDFRSGRKCIYCANILRSERLRKDFDVIQKAFERENCKLLTLKNEYKNGKHKLKYICPNGHYHEISWNSFQQGHRCLECDTERKKHIKYKGELNAI